MPPYFKGVKVIMKLTENQIKEICEYIQKTLLSATLLHFMTEDGEKFPLLDYLSSEETIKEGREEIENLVEDIYIDLMSFEFNR